MANKKIKGMSVQIGGDASGLAKVLDSTNAKSRDLQGKLSTINKLLKLDPSNVTLLAQKQDLLSQSIETTSAKLKALEKAQGDVEKAFADKKIGQDEYIEFQKELINTKSALQRFKSQADDTSKGEKKIADEAKNAKSDIKDLGDQSVKLGDIIKNSIKAEAIVAGLKVIGDTIKDVSKSVINVGSDFEASMSQVAATMGMTAESIRDGNAQYKSLKDAAEECGATTKYTAAQSADALNYLALAGYDAEKSIATLPKILTLAQAGGMDIAYTSDMVTDSMGALGLETDSLDNYIDQLTKTSQKSNTNVQQLGEGILVCAGTVTATGQPIDKMNTALGVLANNGIKGAEGGTKLRNILMSLTAPTEDASELMEKLGINVADSSGEIRDIDDIMGDLNKTLSQMSEAERSKTLKKIFNKQDISGVSALLKSTSGEFQNLYKEIGKCDGAASNMADTMNDNLKGKTYEFQSALEALGISVYNKFSTPLQKSLGNVTDRITDMDKAVKDGKLSDAFDNLADGFETLTDVGMNCVEVMLPVFIDGLAWICNNSDLIIGGLTGIAAAMLMQEGVDFVNKLKKGYAEYKEKVDAATVSQYLFNAAQEASPWGWIATLAGVAVGTISTLIIKSDEASGKMNDLTDEQQNLVDKCKDLHDSADDEIQDMLDKRDATAENAGACKVLAQKLYEINEKEKLSNGDKARMVELVEQLNQQMPELNLQMDKETGHLKNQKAEVMKLIDEQIKLAKVKAAQEDITEISKKVYEAQKEMSEAQDEYKNKCKESQKAHTEFIEAELELTKFRNKNTDSAGRFVGDYDELETLERKVSKLQSSDEQAQQSVVDLDDAVNNAKESYNKWNKELDSTTKFVTDNNYVIAETDEKLKTVSITYGEKTIEVTQGTREAIAEINEAYDEAFADREQELRKSLDIFSEFALDSELSADTLINNMHSNLVGVSNWADGLKELTKRGLDEGLIEQLREAGPSSASQVAAMRQMTDQQLEQYNKDYRDILSKTRDITEEELSKTRKENDKQIDLLVKQDKNKQENVKKSKKDLAKAGGKGYKEGLNQSNLKGATQNEINGIKSTISNNRNGVKQTWLDLARACTGGMLQGFREGKGPITAEAINTHSAAYEAVKKFNKINSPSKRYEELSMYNIMGSIVGYRKNGPKLLDTIDDINRAALDHASRLSLADSLQTVNATARGVYEQAYLYDSQQGVNSNNNQNADNMSDNSKVSALINLLSEYLPLLLAKDNNTYLDGDKIAEKVDSRLAERFILSERGLA